MPRPALAVVAVAWIPAAIWVHIVDVWAFPFDRVVCGAGFASMLLLASTRPDLAGWLPVRALAWVGGLSYSLYLVHQPLLVALSPPMLARSTDEAVILSLLVGAPLSVVAAWLFFQLAERPVLARLRSR